MNCFFISRRKFEKNRHYEQNKKVNEKKILQVDAVPGSFFAITKEFLLKNDYLYDKIFMYGEEIILGRQVREKGYKAVIINSSVYVHDHIQERFSNLKMFKNDRKSLLVYYDLFDKLKWYEKLYLNVSIFLGTMEYSLACHIYHLIKR